MHLHKEEGGDSLGILDLILGRIQDQGLDQVLDLGHTLDPGQGHLTVVEECPLQDVEEDLGTDQGLVVTVGAEVAVGVALCLAGLPGTIFR